jgi:cytosylglucuronate decarboxylase
MSSNLTVPRILYLRLFKTCNSSCMMCDFSKERVLPRLPQAGLLQALRGLVEHGVQEIRFTGGEPLLYTELTGLIAAAATAGATVRLMTNGWLLSDERVELLLESGLSQLVVSIDGPQAALHDRIRATPGLFQRAMNGIEHARSYAGRRRLSLSIGVTTIVMAENYRLFPEFPRLLADYGCDWWLWNPIKDRPRSLLSESDLKDFYSLLPGIVDKLRDKGVQLMVPVLPNHEPDCHIFGDRPGQIQAACTGSYPANTSCRVLDRVGFVDFESSLIHACPLTLYRGGQVAQAFDLLRDDLSRAWNTQIFRERRIAFAKQTHLACTGCEPLMRRLHQEVEAAERLEAREADCHLPGANLG